MMGNYHVRFGKGVDKVKYLSTLVHYNSIITAHAILMIFFMVENSFMLNMKSQPSLDTNMLNDNNNVVKIGNNNNNNDGDKNYVKGARICFIGVLRYNNSSSFGQNNTHRKYSTISALNKNAMSSKLHPYFITGFIDGEGSFSIFITSHDKTQTGWGVKISFNLTLHEKDLALLEQIRNYFGGVGKIRKSGKQLNQLKIESMKDLSVIMDHLEKYPLITKKREVFEMFKQAFNMIKNKEHLTMPGLTKIVIIKASINRGLSDKLKVAFPFIDKMPLAITKVLGEAKPEIPDPFWLAGFTSARREGCFLVNIYNSNSCKLGKAVSIAFLIAQHVHDSLLLTSFERYLDCGKYSDRSDKIKVGDFAVYKYSDIVEKIIPFFEKYPILGVKNLNFLDFCKIAELMRSGAHKTQEGLDEIREIKAGMNMNRK
jgi:hypothetical protein